MLVNPSGIEENFMIKSCSVSNYLQRDGFVMVSNLLISHQSELGINNRELATLVKIMKNARNFRLSDSQLDPTVSPRTLQRTRKSLVDKGLLTFKIWKTADEEGHIRTEGITYDLSLLEEKLQNISDCIAKDRDEEATRESDNYIMEFGEDSPMANFLTSWKDHYGDNYYLSPYEKKWYNNLSEEEQRYIGRIFEYCEYSKLFKTITPRIVLFIKNRQRWNQLKEYCTEMFPESECRKFTEEELDNFKYDIADSAKENNISSFVVDAEKECLKKKEKVDVKEEKIKDIVDFIKRDNNDLRNTDDDDEIMVTEAHRDWLIKELETLKGEKINKGEYYEL